MDKKETVVIVVLFILASGFSYFYNFTDIDNDEINQVCFGRTIDERCFNVEIADSAEERQQGLMFRKSLDKNSGMLFMFEKSGNYPFWMKNTLIPLDIIWINSDLKVVEIESAVPCETQTCVNYGGNFEALYVLELNAGTVKKIGLEIGDRVSFK